MSADEANPNSAGQLARKLARIQARLRLDLFEELQAHEDDLETIFDPYSFSSEVHDLREKYLTRLQLLQALVQQLASLSTSGSKRTARVTALSAETQNELVERVNRKLGRLNGSRILDVKFVPGSPEEDWSALITYEVNPLSPPQDSTAAWM
jgi:hypothetical protein